MKKIMILLLSLSVLLTGCKQIEIPNFKLIEVNNGDVIDMDLDGDGIDEKISFTCKYNSYNDYTYCESISLTVGSSIYEPEFCTPVDKCYIANLDAKKDFYYILLGDLGPSNDEVTDVVVYKNSSLKHIGSFPGVCTLSFTGYNEGYRFNHDGTVTAPVRANVLQTWWFDAVFEITQDSVKMVEQDFYDVDYDTELLVDFEFYKEPDESSEKTLVRSETPMKFVAHDNKEWVKVRYNDIYGVESEAYFKCYECFADESHETFFSDVFDDLCYAD